MDEPATQQVISPQLAINFEKNNLDVADSNIGESTN